MTMVGEPFPVWCTYAGQVGFLEDDDVVGTKGGISLAVYQHLCADKMRTSAASLTLHHGFPCPKEVAESINAGRQQRVMALMGRYEAMHLDEQGHLHSENDEPALIYQDGVMGDANKRGWWDHGQLVRAE
jgi:hypothetical protein